MRTLPLVAIWAAMLALLAVSVAATLLPIGVWRQAISLGIAVLKAGLILWFFMGFRRADGLNRLYAAGALAFLAVMITLLSADYFTRGWLTS